MEAKSVEPALGVLDGFNHRTPGELFIVSGIAVNGQTGPDELPLIIVDEFGGVRIVCDEEVGKSSDQYGRNTLL